MIYDMADLPAAERYKLLVNTITPRPIAWVGTLDDEGRRNLAPYSFFNAMLSDPALVVIGIAGDTGREGEAEKDTLRGIRQTNEFTISLVSERDAAKAVQSAVNAPAAIDEFEMAGIEMAHGRKVKAPFVASAPVQFECRLWQLIEPTPGNAIVIGEVLAMHIEDRLVSEEDGKTRIDAPAMNLVGRAHGRAWYWRGGDMVEIERTKW